MELGNIVNTEKCHGNIRGRQMHALGLCGPKNNCKKPLIKLVPVRYPKEKPIGVIMSHQRPLNVEWPVVIFRKGVSDQKHYRIIYFKGVLGHKNEKRLVVHIQRLAAAGFAPDRNTVRRLAYNFAEKLKLKH
ncbi:unnamed protein product [Acanthoscelides obtectus]|uniref:Uncharacterized protein n=1 Tax=Acanthoscelides obtectus TaxID=200917 RepID=A0A9P0KDF3_ACAOB|nr:unnamed protein product [Acanthoscelides obtectus]CAK1647616.1 hypothetical protein AOBTE_LOCUS15297 [Acanthoscelides obtectus]